MIKNASGEFNDVASRNKHVITTVIVMSTIFCLSTLYHWNEKLHGFTSIDFRSERWFTGETIATCSYQF